MTEREALIACETTGEHQMFTRTVERVTFECCPCGAMCLSVDGEPIQTTDEFIERLGGEEEAARIGALLSQPEEMNMSERSFTDALGEPTNEWIAAHTNVERAGWAETAVEAFRAACSGDMDETAIYDLVCNLGHLCDRLSAEHEDFDLTFEGMVESARSHYEGERGEGDGIEGAARFG